MSRAGLVVIAFRKIQTLPERRDFNKYTKGTKFQKSLTEFISNRIKQSFKPWKQHLQDNNIIKKRAVIQMIESTQSGQKKLFQRWKHMTQINNQYEKCRLLSNLFEGCKDGFNRNMQKVLFRKHYNMSQISTLQNYFSKLIETSEDNGRVVLREMKDYAYSNPWFRKAAVMLSINTRLNVQKSFWRMRQNTDFSETQSFLITSNQPHYLSSSQPHQYSTDSMQGSLATSRSIQEKSIIYQHDQSFESDFGETEEKTNYLREQQKRVGVSIMERIFNQNSANLFNRWFTIALPEKKIETVYQSMKNKQKDEEFDFVSHCGAAERIRNICQNGEIKVKSHAFRMLARKALSETKKELASQGGNNNVALQKKMNSLTKQCKALEEDKMALEKSLQQKEQTLKQSEQLITNLSLRINYFVCQKFIDRVSTVMTNVRFRNLNDSYDAMIDEANRQWQRQEQDVFYDQDF